MMNQIVVSLYISLIGMVLVFSALSLIWLAVAIVVAMMSRHKENKADEQNQRLAVALAVTVALMETNKQSMHKFPLPPTALVSAWQAVMRSNILYKRGYPK
jgi:Na+-transporting methylmalonyl-CoA/oxaloacetate decarboxylase gamma subunit